MIKSLIAALLLVVSAASVAATLISGKDGTRETIVSVNSSGQLTTTLDVAEDEDEQWKRVAAGPWEREEVAASATDQSLGTAGSTGDYLAFCNCQVTTSGANGTCGIEDGTNTAFDDITVVPASTALGNHTIRVESQATTAAGWEVTTGSAATMQCYGRFDTAGD